MLEYFYAIALLATLVVLVICICFFKMMHKIESQKIKLVTGNLLLLLLLGTGTFTAFETYYRFIYDATDSFSISYTSEMWYRRHFRYNNFNVRDNISYDYKVQNGRTRLSIIGDSFTAGTGIANVEDRFVNLIRKKSLYEVHSLAFCGANTLSEVQLMEQLVSSGYELNDVLLVFNLNNATAISDSWQQKNKQIYANYESNNFFVKNSFLVDTLRYRIKRKSDPLVSNYFYMLPDDYEGATWEKLKRLILRLDSLVAGKNAKLYVVVFPLVHTNHNGYPYKHIHSKLNKFFSEHNMPHLDLLDALKQYDSSKLIANKYDGHPNEFAHRIAAEQILAFLEKEKSRK